jgi:hypothetical protein
MTSYEPNHYSIYIQPIFVNTDAKEYPFASLDEEENTSIEYQFIVDTLRLHFGDEVDLTKKSLVPGRFVIAMLSNAQMKILRGICEYTGEVPVKYGRSYLKFEVHGYTYDKPPCDDNCDCCECLGCCDFKKN